MVSVMSSLVLSFLQIFDDVVTVEISVQSSTMKHWLMLRTMDPSLSNFYLPGTLISAFVDFQV